LTWHENKETLFRKKLLKTKKSTTTSRVLEPTSKKTKIVHENDSLELNTIELFDKDNKLIDGATIIQGNLVSIKCYVQYWRHFTFKWHKIRISCNKKTRSI
jgi:hypothetical protein